MRKYTPPVIDYAKRRKSIAIPDQSLTIQEIVKRYVRGVPVDVTQRQGVYVDQNDHDLEKLSRMDFGEKSDYARILAEQAEQLKADHEEAQAQRREAQAAKVEADQAARESGSVQKKTGAPAPEA